MNGFLARFRAAPSRPPAGARVWRDGPLELAAGGAARLVERGAWVGAVDARLGGDELAAALGVDAADRRTRDAACVVAAFERWGEGAVRQLEGAFAAVVWDRDAQAGFAVRDRLGRRPLFRTVEARPGGGELAIGSSLAGLRPRAPAALNLERAADVLAGRAGDGRATFDRAIERVPAATLATLAAPGTWAERTYWHLDPAATFAGSDADAEAQFRERFDAAVAANLGGRLGAFLSGGLDSSSIVTTARQLDPGADLPVFSIVYERPDADETRHLEAVLAHTRLRAHRVDGERLSLLEGLDDDLAAVGEPFAMPNLFLTRTLYAEARAAGLEAVLDGFAGDNVVGHGERRLTELARSGRIPTLVREIRAVARTSRRPRRAVLELARDWVWAPLVAPLTPRPPEASFAHPDLPRPGAEAERGWTDRAAHAAELASPLLPHAFEAAHAVGAAHGIEPRFPFASVPLVELCLSLPAHQRMRGGLTRSILRRAMRGRLPESVRLRPGKARLATRFADALFVRDAERLRQLVAEDVPAAGVLDAPALARAVERALADPEARADLAVPVWRAVAVARWLALTRRSPPA